MLAVYIYARLRREERCWLQESDVDFSAGIHGMIRVRAKTVDDKSCEPKTKVNRVVPISSKLKIYLEKYPIPGVEGKWYFSTPNGKRRDPDNLSRYLVSIRKRFFSALAASIFGLACAAYRCTPPHNPSISLPGQKIPRFRIGNQ